ncbi:response regulator [Paenibacillus sp. GCM10027626]|uniref:response regulator n=1 Tax=Paenibacillus sp. GCM10027626 TaxID=3273411 RepID=UPI0036315B56
MLRVMIVDDEPDIADSLHMLLQERLPFEAEIYKAYSGKAALDWAKRGKFDIVLTDIRMPVLSGLELQKQIHALWPRCKVIFLTGHSEFDYVYEAIHHNNTRYLLKTEGHEFILKTAAIAAQEIIEEQKLEGLMTQALLQMEQTMPLMRNELLLDLLQGEPLAAEERAAQFKELHIEMEPHSQLMLMLAKLPLPAADGQGVSKAQLHAGMKVISEQYGYNWLRISYFFVTKRTIAWFLQPRSGMGPVNWADIALAIREFAENAASAFLDNFNFLLTCVLDTTPCQWEEIADRWALLQARSRQSDERSGLIDAGTDTLEHDRIKLLHKADRIGDCLSGNSADAFKAEWQRLWDGEEAIAETVAADLLGAALSLVFLRTIFSVNLQEKLAAAVDLAPLLRPSEVRLERDVLREYYEQLAANIFRLQQEVQSERRDQTIETIKRYIQNHLADDLSLVRLSELAGLNPSYLSRTFKKATGQNVLNHIHEMKLQAAQRMLCRSEMKIQEISAALGFISPPHFTRFFKKAAGIVPQDYRNQFGDDRS